MTALGQSPEVLVGIEQVFAQHPTFGDNIYIRRQLEVCLKRRLDKVARRLPVARDLLLALDTRSGQPLDHVIGDTVVRCAIMHAHTQIEKDAPYGLPLADCEKIMAATVRHLERGNFDSPLNDGSLERLGPEPYHGWLWTDNHADDVFGRSFRFLLKDRYGAIPCTPSGDEIAMLKKGIQLLKELVPTLAPSALRHAHIIACVPSAGEWTGVASASQFHLGGTVFLTHSLHSPWWVAEHLLHESLHQKLYDFRHGHSLLEFDYLAVEESRMVCSPWNSEQLNKANLWDVHRVFAALHVYVHLALLALVAEQRAQELEATYGPFQGMIKSIKAFERAHYLGEQLKEHCWGQLGLAGKRLADWLASVLDVLNPAPPPKGAYIHLYLDLYEREANQVASALVATENMPSNLARRLVSVAKEEIASARQVLTTINADKHLDRLNGELAQYGESELGTNFPELRRLIGSTLMDASFDRYKLTESGEHDELLRDMIERASHGVYAVLAGYPRSVADAKRRASELRFHISSRDEVGRLLAVLACAVPTGGRVLEIGTGVGVGLGWITEGLGKRTDVEVISVESNPQLSDAVRSWPWPAYLQLVTGDALESLGSLGSFNLVFADAAPVKYGNIESVIQMLCPGGVLLIDDFTLNTEATKEELLEKETLRRTLLSHPKLHGVEMDWASGLVLATRVMDKLSPLMGEPPGAAKSELARTA